MAQQQPRRNEGFSKGAIRALRLIVQMRQEKEGTKDVKMPPALLRLEEMGMNPNFWKDSKKAFNFSEDDIFRLMKDESTTLEEVLKASGMRMRALEPPIGKKYGSMEEEVQACLKTTRNPYVDNLASAVNGAKQNPVSSMLSPRTKAKMFGISPERKSQQKVQRNKLGKSFNNEDGLTVEQARKHQEIGSQLHQFLLSEAAKMRLFDKNQKLISPNLPTGSDADDDFIEKLNMLLDDELIHEQKTQQAINAMRETASSQFPQIVGSSAIITENGRESEFTQQVVPTTRSQFPSVTQTKEEAYRAQLGVLSDRNTLVPRSDWEAAEFMTKRSSLLEVLSKATEPIKYSQGIDDSECETVNSLDEKANNDINVTKILRDKRLNNERVFRDEQRITATAASHLIQEIDDMERQIHVKSLVGNSIDLRSVMENHARLKEQLSMDFNEKPAIDPENNSGEVNLTDPASYIEQRIPLHAPSVSTESKMEPERKYPVLKKSIYDQEEKEELPKQQFKASYITHISPVRYINQEIKERMKYFNHEHSTKAVESRDVYRASRIDKLKKQQRAQEDCQQALLNVDSSFLTDPSAYNLIEVNGVSAMHLQTAAINRKNMIMQTPSPQMGEANMPNTACLRDLITTLDQSTAIAVTGEIPTTTTTSKWSKNTNDFGNQTDGQEEESEQDDVIVMPQTTNMMVIHSQDRTSDQQKSTVQTNPIDWNDEVHLKGVGGSGHYSPQNQSKQSLLKSKQPPSQAEQSTYKSLPPSKMLQYQLKNSQQQDPDRSPSPILVQKRHMNTHDPTGEDNFIYQSNSDLAQDQTNQQVDSAVAQKSQEQKSKFLPPGSSLISDHEKNSTNILKSTADFQQQAGDRVKASNDPTEYIVSPILTPKLGRDEDEDRYTTLQIDSRKQPPKTMANRQETLHLHPHEAEIIPERVQVQLLPVTANIYQRKHRLHQKKNSKNHSVERKKEDPLQQSISIKAVSQFYKKSDINRQTFSLGKPFKFNQGNAQNQESPVQKDVQFEMTGKSFEPNFVTTTKKEKEKVIKKRIVNRDLSNTSENKQGTIGWEVDKLEDITMQFQILKTSHDMYGKHGTAIPFKTRGIEDIIPGSTINITNNNMALSQIPSSQGHEETVTMSVGCGSSSYQKNHPQRSDFEYTSMGNLPNPHTLVSTPLSNLRGSIQMHQPTTPEGVEIILGEYDVTVPCPLKEQSSQSKISQEFSPLKQEIGGANWRQGLSGTFHPHNVLLNAQSELSTINLKKAMNEKWDKAQARQLHHMRNRSNASPPSPKPENKYQDLSIMATTVPINLLKKPSENKELKHNPSGVPTLMTSNTGVHMLHCMELSKGTTTSPPGSQSVSQPSQPEPGVSTSHRPENIDASLYIHEDGGMSQQFATLANGGHYFGTSSIEDKKVTMIPQTQHTNEISQLAQINPLTDDGGRQAYMKKQKQPQVQKFNSKQIPRKLLNPSKILQNKSQLGDQSRSMSKQQICNEDLPTLHITGSNTSHSRPQIAVEEGGPPKLISQEHYEEMDGGNVEQWDTKLKDKTNHNSPDIIRYSQRIALKNYEAVTPPELQTTVSQPKPMSTENVHHERFPSLQLVNQSSTVPNSVKTSTPQVGEARCNSQIGAVAIIINRNDQSVQHEGANTDSDIQTLKGVAMTIKQVVPQDPLNNQGRLRDQTHSKERNGLAQVQRHSMPKRDLPHRARNMAKAMKKQHAAGAARESCFVQDQPEHDSEEINLQTEVMSAAAHLASISNDESKYKYQSIQSPFDTAESISATSPSIIIHESKTAQQEVQLATSSLKKKNRSVHPTKLNDEKQYLMLDMGQLTEESPQKESAKKQFMRDFSSQEQSRLRRKVLSNKGSRQDSHIQPQTLVTHKSILRIDTSDKIESCPGQMTRQSLEGASLGTDSIGVCPLSPVFTQHMHKSVKAGKKLRVQQKAIQQFNTIQALNTDVQQVSLVAAAPYYPPTSLIPQIAAHLTQNSASVDKNIGYRSTVSKTLIDGSGPFRRHARPQIATTATILPQLMNVPSCNYETTKNHQIEMQVMNIKEGAERLQTSYDQKEESITDPTPKRLPPTGVCASSNLSPNASRFDDLNYNMDLCEGTPRHVMLRNIAYNMKTGVSNRSPVTRRSHLNKMQPQSRNADTLRNPMYDMLSVNDRQWAVNRAQDLASQTNLGNTGLLMGARPQRNKVMSQSMQGHPLRLQVGEERMSLDFAPRKQNF